MTRPSIAVIGAGASGTLLSLQLLRHAPSCTRITLIERDPQFGPGLAYATVHPNHLLNVPAGRMSAYADEPAHFLHWLQSHMPRRGDAAGPVETSFVPRRLYGAYLRDLLQGAAAGGAIELLQDNAVGMQPSPLGAGTLLRLGSGRLIPADIVVLAMGNDRPAEPPQTAALAATPCWRPDPWASDAFTGLDPDASVLLIGTGLTMVDAVISLLDQRHVGPIHAFSRRGLLPCSHGVAPPLPLELPPRADLRNLTRTVRQHADGAGEDWRGAIDALRPITQELWQGLSLENRQRFLRHLRPWWDVHRHRMAPQIAARIGAARASGQLQVHTGRLVTAESRDGHAEVELRSRNGSNRTLHVARVVNCTGPCTDPARSRDPLMSEVLRHGLGRADALRLGLDVDSTCALRGQDGAVSGLLYALGPLTRGVFWEITAIPDIRRQSESLAQHLGQRLRDPARQVATASA